LGNTTEQHATDGAVRGWRVAVLGALGLVLPGLTLIHPELTPLAAAGLEVIMVGAVVVTLAIGGGAAALFPFGVGLLLVVVAYRRGQPVVTSRAGHQAGRRLAGVGSRSAQRAAERG
jgi:hypothetical protein